MAEKQFKINDKNFEGIINDLGIILIDENTGLLVNTLKKNFLEEYKGFDIITSWECFVEYVNMINNIVDLHDILINHSEEIQEILDKDMVEK